MSGRFTVQHTGEFDRQGREVCAHMQPLSELCSGCARDSLRAAINSGEVVWAALPAPEPPLETVEVCPIDGTVAHFKCSKCEQEWYTHTASMAHSNQRFAPVVRSLRATLQRIVVCARSAGAMGCGDYRDIEVDATDALALTGGAALPPQTGNPAPHVIEARTEHGITLASGGVSLLRAPQSGPWTYHPDEHGESRWGWLFVKDTFPHRRLWFDRGEISEDECIAIRDALNVVAGRGAGHPERET